MSRRYKHFDWLHERLVAKFGVVIPGPPLPDKQLSGLYEAELIDRRMKQLQSFVDRMCRHPVMAHSEVWTHFIRETDEKRWTNGKRRAESDLYVGNNFLQTIQVRRFGFECIVCTCF